MCPRVGSNHEHLACKLNTLTAASLKRRSNFVFINSWAPSILVQYSGWALPIHYNAFDVQVGDKNRRELAESRYLPMKTLLQNSFWIHMS